MTQMSYRLLSCVVRSFYGSENQGQDHLTSEAVYLTVCRFYKVRQQNVERNDDTEL